MLTAYNGREPYIFISYAHKDASQVMSILQRMREGGFRIWYDKGIQGGVEWPEFIAGKLFASSCVLAFISRNALESKNCRREINFAVAKDKPLLAVYLEECELPLGMQMQLDTLQALFCTTEDASEELMQKLLATEILRDALEDTKDTNPEQQVSAIRNETAIPQQTPSDSREERTPTEEKVLAEPLESTDILLNAKDQERTETLKEWVCVCGKKNPAEVRKCSCGHWHCSCGRVHAAYVSSCCCGGNKWGEMAKQSVHSAATPAEEKKQEQNIWKCTCGKENALDVRKCNCGHWHCSCGRVLAPYVSSCVCGKSKNGRF